MINSFISVLQLILILILAAILLYILLVKGDNNRSSYLMFLIDLCMLWMVLI
ncbi:hypothetical protein [Methanobrevibacter sp.]|uniref:hypothetical protein n=1 Tax=Methanobrevibacter sp. TaxID=66852 RepID=UPI002E7989C2|nr:hypothetical protein [Methanobrevibacter sp.]MEE1336135.1 hypothetical protein [Methanobrevibacter sp.]